MKKILLLLSFFYTVGLFAQSQVNFYTSKGDFRVEVREDLMPITAGNFLSLVDTGYYDGVIFHRVVAGFVIQGGDPTGTGSGGPGYTIEDEYHPSMNHDSAGVIAMAKTTAPNSAGSQFYFTLAAQPSLNQTYAVFGSCIEGLEVIQEIGMVAVQGNDRPWQDVTIDSIRRVNVSTSTHNRFEQVRTEIYPNPINASTTIQYDVKKAGTVRIEIYNMQGRRVQTLFDGYQAAGIQSLDWDAAPLGQGIYQVTIQTAAGIGTRKVAKVE